MKSDEFKAKTPQEVAAMTLQERKTIAAAYLDSRPKGDETCLVVADYIEAGHVVWCEDINRLYVTESGITALPAMNVPAGDGRAVFKRAPTTH